jgi:hypothetical protein
VHTQQRGRVLHGDAAVRRLWHHDGVAPEETAANCGGSGTTRTADHPPAPPARRSTAAAAAQHFGGGGRGGRDGICHGAAGETRSRRERQPQRVARNAGGEAGGVERNEGA